MKNYLISWISEYHDFEKNEDHKFDINYNGPSFDLHRSFFTDHDQHILLSTGPEGDELGQRLQRDLNRGFSGRSIQLIGLDIGDPTDYQLVRSKIDEVLNRIKAHAKRIDLMFTTGTSVMRIGMAITHLGTDAPTRLIQGKDPRMTGGRGEFSELILAKDDFVGRLYVKSKPSQSSAIYKAEALLPVYHQGDKVAQMERITTLILGASGTGKEHLAKYIHQQSARSAKPYIPVNCASLNDEILQSDLFGHKKGSFSFAHQDRKGYFEIAHGGTIFLDEIGDISPRMQQSLLRVIQEKEVLPLGGNQAKKIDVRIIAATHVDLEQKITQGKFREDLYYRLSAIELHTPELKAYGKADLEGLIHFLNEKLADEYGAKKLILDQELWQFFHLYPFKGNIRELENIFTHFFVFGEGNIGIKDLPPRYKRQGIDYDWTMEAIKVRHVQRMLTVFNGNLTHTAKALDVSYNTMMKLIKKHGLSIPGRVGEDMNSSER